MGVLTGRMPHVVNSRNVSCNNMLGIEKRKLALPMKRFLALLVLIVIGIVVYMRPREVESDINLVKIQYDMPEVSSSVSLHLDGYRYHSIVGSSRFVGNISIDDTLIEDADVRLNSFGPLIGILNDDLDMSTYASIYLDDSLQEATIIIHEEGTWSYREGLILTGPSSNREEAIGLFQSHLSEQVEDTVVEFK